jgi:hypothetical protein
MIRPELRDWLWQRSEVFAALVPSALGLWLMWLGGWVLLPLGGLLVVLGAALGLSALRRLRFAQGVLAPGMVEVVEGQVGYLGPAFGGYVALPDLTELRLVTIHRRRLWRLKQADGQALLVPVDAVGAERLFDAFASLPGMDTALLVAVLGAPPPTSANESRVIWRRAGPELVRAAS